MTRYIPTSQELVELGFSSEKGLHTLGAINRRLMVYVEEDFSYEGWGGIRTETANRLREKYLGTARISISNIEAEALQKKWDEMSVPELSNYEEEELVKYMKDVICGVDLELISKQFLHDLVEAFKTNQ